MLSSLDVRNRSSIAKIQQPQKQLLDALVSNLSDINQERIASVYLVGSLGRGEYEEEYSDINLYVVVNRETAQVLEERGFVCCRRFYAGTISFRTVPKAPNYC